MQIKNKKAAVFAMTVMILALLVIIATFMAVIVVRSAYTAARLSRATQAYFLAEAGIEMAIRDYYDNGFTSGGSPINCAYPKINIPLGNGTFSVILDTSKYSTRSEVVIASNSTIGDPDKGGASRTIRVLVKDTTIPAFKFPALGGGRVIIAGGSEVWGDVHSNYSGWGSGIRVGGYFFSWNTGDVHLLAGDPGSGRVTTVDNSITVTSRGTVDSGVRLPSQPAVPLPPLDSDFFQWYYEQADIASPRRVYTGNWSWNNATLTSSTGVIYVKGNVHLEGNTTITGCLVAEGDINIGTDIWPDSSIAQTQVGRLPALMSRYGHILIMDPITLNGMVYAQDDLTVLSLIGKVGPAVINGAVYAQGGMFLHEKTQLTYVMPNPPGLSEETPLKVMCWDE